MSLFTYLFFFVFSDFEFIFYRCTLLIFMNKFRVFFVKETLISQVFV